MTDLGKGFMGPGKERTTQTEAKAEHGCGHMQDVCWLQLVLSGLSVERVLGE